MVRFFYSVYLILSFVDQTFFSRFSYFRSRGCDESCSMGQCLHPSVFWRRYWSYVPQLVNWSLRATHIGCRWSTPDCFPLQWDVSPMEFYCCLATASGRRRFGCSMGTKCRTAIPLYRFRGRETVAYFQAVSRKRWGWRCVGARGYSNNFGFECLEVPMECYRHSFGV